ncbi:MAG: thioesterase [Robiginitomaculum sp.]|nr:MAG: thioesterase [Robiginitomaculum sp.]
MAVYTRQVKVRFAYCDPAGIIFYPRYFEILNSVVEDWFCDELGHSFRDLLENFGIGTPMVDIQTEFLKPCRLDDLLDISLSLEKAGTSSAVIIVNARIGDALHIRTRGVLVCAKTDLSSSAPWPDDIAINMQKYLP